MDTIGIVEWLSHVSPYRIGQSVAALVSEVDYTTPGADFEYAGTRSLIGCTADELYSFTTAYAFAGIMMSGVR